ncbi:SusC/RagA family TonB-linked outer membrane protein [Maribacter sp. 2304DJ31-5]|uniref:SusC/RagA family TonB-linked outer membrane protein n=1 Tax=Maribacter sp. 2304DJ31-5 TaxID=3386273 RepID=UPI0039BD59F2
MIKKQYLHVLLFCLFGLLAQNGWAQIQKTITGQVTSSTDGIPLGGVSIVVKETTNGTVTDFDGYYSIEAQEGDILTFSYLGFKTLERTVSDNLSINIALDEDVSNLDEVVVVGYGTQKKSDLTGSVVSVKAEDFNPGPVVSVSNQLQGTAAGVVLSQNSAQPGGGFSVRIRGRTSINSSNEPLYVVDGFPITSDPPTNNVTGSTVRQSPSRNPLNTLNPEDIESIEILKDASATAIYGARGANGVVLITTKKGKSGKASINYSSSYTVSTPTELYDLLNGSEFAQVTNEEAGAPIFSAAQVNTLGEGTNWQEEILRNSSLFGHSSTVQKHQISFSGATDKVNYYISGNYYKNEGLVQKTGLERFSGRLNLSTQISKKFKLGLNLTATRTKDQLVNSGSGDSENAGVFINARRWSPAVPVFDQNGNFSVHPSFPTQISNPVSILNIDDEIVTKRVLATFYGEYEISDGLKAKLNLGIDDQNIKGRAFIPTTLLRGEQLNGEGELRNEIIENLLGEFTLNYSKQWGDHSLNALFGYTYQELRNESFGVVASNFSNETININNLAVAQNADRLFSFKAQPKLISYLSRVNYSWKDRYLFTFSFRADGSSKFINNPWGYFPSGAFAWKVHKENFFKSEVIDEFKVRVTYGVTGNQEVPSQISQQVFGTTVPFAVGLDAARTNGLAAINPGIPDLRWESTSQLNSGIDLALFNRKLSISADLYYKLTSDILLEFPLPLSSGFTTTIANRGKVKNQGVELGVRYSDNLTDQLRWTSAFNIAYNENKWVDRAGQAINPWVDEFGSTEDEYGYIVDGIFRTQEEVNNSGQRTTAENVGDSPGMFRFRDVDGDGVIRNTDQVLLGVRQPKVTGGWNNSFEYKNIDLNFFFQGSFGNVRRNGIRARFEDVGDILLSRNKLATVLDRWTPNNPNGSIPSGQASISGFGSRSGNSVYVEDASFVRLRNVTLGYTFKPKQSAFDNFRIYADVQNLFVITKYTGLDPETDDDFPNLRSFTLGLNVSF